MILGGQRLYSDLQRVRAFRSLVKERATSWFSRSESYLRDANPIGWQGTCQIYWHPNIAIQNVIPSCNTKTKSNRQSSSFPLPNDKFRLKFLGECVVAVFTSLKVLFSVCAPCRACLMAWCPAGPVTFRRQKSMISGRIVLNMYVSTTKICLFLFPNVLEAAGVDSQSMTCT